MEKPCFLPLMRASMDVRESFVPLSPISPAPHLPSARAILKSNQKKKIINKIFKYEIFILINILIIKFFYF